ncbi:hypothetical protein LguiB_017691 [Lonicera macranthoides]
MAYGLKPMQMDRVLLAYKSDFLSRQDRIFGDGQTRGMAFVGYDRGEDRPHIDLPELNSIQSGIQYRHCTKCDQAQKKGHGGSTTPPCCILIRSEYHLLCLLGLGFKSNASKPFLPKGTVFVHSRLLCSHDNASLLLVASIATPIFSSKVTFTFRPKRPANIKHNSA